MRMSLARVARASRHCSTRASSFHTGLSRATSRPACWARPNRASTGTLKRTRLRVCLCRSTVSRRPSGQGRRSTVRSCSLPGSRTVTGMASSSGRRAPSPIPEACAVTQRASCAPRLSDRACARNRSRPVASVFEGDSRRLNSAGPVRESGSGSPSAIAARVFVGRGFGQRPPLPPSCKFLNIHLPQTVPVRETSSRSGVRPR